MSRLVVRAASAVLMLVVVGCLLLLLQVVRLPANVIGNPPVNEPLPVLRSGRPLQALYQIQAQASRDGWTDERLREAGDLWREAGDITRAVGYWQAVTLPDAPLLRNLSQALIDLERWAEAADSLDQLLTLLLPGSSDRSWAQFQLGLITASYDSARALDLLQAAQPTYGDSVTRLLPLLAAASDSTQAGIALAKNDLWPYAELAFSQSADPLSLAYLGLARDMQGKNGGVYIQTAVDAAPDNAQVRFLQGLHLRLTYDYQGSLDAMIQAVALDPENPALYAELGKAYQQLGDTTTAERWLRFAVTLDASFQPLLNTFYNDEKSALLSLGLVDEAVLPFDSVSTPGGQPAVQP